MKHQSLLPKEIGSWSRSIVTTIMDMQLPFLICSKVLNMTSGHRSGTQLYPQGDLVPTFTNFYKVTLN